MRNESTARRVLFATAYFPPYAPGGAEHSIEALARALAEHGHHVTVVTPRLGPLEHRTVRVTKVRAGLKASGPHGLVRQRSFLRPDVQLRLARGYSRAIVASGAAVVHCQHLAVLPAAYLAARRRRIPIVVTVHDLAAVCPLAVCLLERPLVPHDCGMRRLQGRCVAEYARQYGISRRRTHVSAALGFLAARLRASLLRRADGRIFVGSDLARLHRDAGLIAPQSTSAVTGNIAIPAAGYPHADQDDGYAVYAGKVSLGKGFGVLLEAMPRLREQCEGFRLVCFGRADDIWRDRIAATEGVEYHGPVARNEVLAAYRKARVAIAPSLWPEPLSRAVLEAQAAGVPVVATSVGGNPDAVTDGDNGLLVPPGNAHALAAAVTRLWSDEPLRTRLARSASATVGRRFSADAVCRRTIAVYDDVTQDKTGRT